MNTLPFTLRDDYFQLGVSLPFSCQVTYAGADESLREKERTSKQRKVVSTWQAFTRQHHPQTSTAAQLINRITPHTTPSLCDSNNMKTFGTNLVTMVVELREFYPAIAPIVALLTLLFARPVVNFL